MNLNSRLITDDIMPMTDHDMLITLNAKMDGLALSFKDFQLDFVSRVAKVETRLDNVDLYHAAIPLKEYDIAYRWVQGIKSNIHLLLAIGGVVCAILGGVVADLVGHWLHV